MLRRLAGITLVTALVCASHPVAIAKTIAEENNLIGPVRTVTTKSPGSSSTETYDPAGNLTEAIVYLEHSDTVTRYSFTYDQHENLREEIVSDASGKLIYRKVFGYARDSSGRETASVAASDDGEFHYAEFSIYDQSGNVSEKLFINDVTTDRSVFDVLGRIIYSAKYKRGQLLGELKHRYDNRGRLSELISYNPQGAMTGRRANQHDDAGKCVQATTEKFEAGQTSKWTSTYEYDATGNWIREVTWNEPGTSQETGAARNPTVQERVIEYYGPSDSKTP
jgi:antitoxin component YwqK of YwqJK toxin-antitoxin module